MPSYEPLTPSSRRRFFELVARTAFCNPFSEERTRLDSELVGYEVKALREDHLEDLTRVVRARLRELERAGQAHLKHHEGADRELMRTVFLFEVYHQYCRDLDTLIRDQIEAGDTPAPVPFARAVLERLRGYGFNARESARYFSIFYQLRRAHHFIVRGLIGASASMCEFRRRLWNNVFTHDIRIYEQRLWNRMEDFSTLLLGPTGTGKGAAAAAIGRSGYIPFDEKRGRFAESFTRCFVSLNLSQFPETLIESELFGHRKGAFTGAVDAQDGVFRKCSPNGAIFLDEIGDVGVPVQIKLLQVLQERRFSPVGSRDSLAFRGRVIAATNRPLDELRGQGLFRDDFFYRLCSDIIHVPPLRRRLEEDPDELLDLVVHGIHRLVGQPAPELVELVCDSLREKLGPHYAWPGNVRELEQAVRQILLTRDYRGGQPAAPPDLLERLTAGIAEEKFDADSLLAHYCALLYRRTGNYEAVARRTNLDRRTVKKYIQQQS